MIVLGHRGVFGRQYSENTLEAFDEAVRQGADGVEFDLRVSKDGELIVVHDPNLRRVAGDVHKITELTCAELALITLRNGGKISTLQEVTSRIYAPMILDMEIKHRDVVEPLIAKLKTSATLRERTIVSSFHAAALLRVRRELPDVRTLFLVRRWPLPLAGRKFWTRVDRLKPWGIAFQIILLRSKRVDFLRKRGLQVGTWDGRGTLREARKARSLQLDVVIVKHVKEMRLPVRGA